LAPRSSPRDGLLGAPWSLPASAARWGKSAPATREGFDRGAVSLSEHALRRGRSSSSPISKVPNNDSGFFLAHTLLLVPCSGYLRLPLRLEGQSVSMRFGVEAEANIKSSAIKIEMSTREGEWSSPSIVAGVGTQMSHHTIFLEKQMNNQLTVSSQLSMEPQHAPARQRGRSGSDAARRGR
jgi:hypothetical protein